MLIILSIYSSVGFRNQINCNCVIEIRYKCYENENIFKGIQILSRFITDYFILTFILSDADIRHKLYQAQR